MHAKHAFYASNMDSLHTPRPTSDHTTITLGFYWSWLYLVIVNMPLYMWPYIERCFLTFTIVQGAACDS